MVAIPDNLGRHRCTDRSSCAPWSRSSNRMQQEYWFRGGAGEHPSWLVIMLQLQCLYRHHVCFVLLCCTVVLILFGVHSQCTRFPFISCAARACCRQVLRANTCSHCAGISVSLTANTCNQCSHLLLGHSCHDCTLTHMRFSAVLARCCILRRCTFGSASLL